MVAQYRVIGVTVPGWIVYDATCTAEALTDIEAEAAEPPAYLVRVYGRGPDGRWRLLRCYRGGAARAPVFLGGLIGMQWYKLVVSEEGDDWCPIACEIVHLGGVRAAAQQLDSATIGRSRLVELAVHVTDRLYAKESWRVILRVCVGSGPIEESTIRRIVEAAREREQPAAF